MARASDAAKRRQWTERLERHRRSGQSVAEFCRAEQISIPSFYQWKRKLLRSTNRKSAGRGGRHGRSRVAAAKFKRLRIVPSCSIPAATIRFGHGVVMEMGSDPQVIEKAIDQLLSHTLTVGSGHSC
jgi:hypothetical protein